MIASFWLGVILAFQGSAAADTRVFASYAGPDTRVEVVVPSQPLDVPKVSPKNHMQFEWLVQGLARLPGAGYSYVPRFRVFEQTPPASGKAPAVARMAMRLWDFNFHRLKLDHSEQYNNRVVDYYLCNGGNPGGEQLFTEDGEGVQACNVDTIFIYDMPSFTDTVEMAREVAHEYGHATLPPVGGFLEPEYWADGYLGERLFLRWFRDEMAAGHLAADDAMGADLPGLDRWVKRNVEPLVLDVALQGPDLTLMAGKTQASMNAFMGTVLYVDGLVPPKVFARSLKLIGSQNAVDYVASAVAAVEEAAPFAVAPPPGAEGKPIWLPLGKSRITGAKPLKRKAGWVLVKPIAGRLAVTPPAQ